MSSQMIYAKLYMIFLIILIRIPHIKTADAFELLILHNNNMRSRLEEEVEPHREYGGFARISHIIKESRKAAATKNGPPVLYLYAGDVYVDKFWKNLYTRKLLIEFLNELKPDVACFGHHDLTQDNILHMQDFISLTKYPLVVSNIHFGNNSFADYIVRPSVILQVGQKIIGIIGYVYSKAHLLPKSSSFHLEDEVNALRRESKHLKEKGVDIIIALGYSRFSTDVTIAKEVKDVDVVIGGCTNTLLWNGPPPGDEHVIGPYPTVIVQSTGKNVLLLRTYGFTKYLGRIYVKFSEYNTITNYSGNPVYLDSAVPQDPVLLGMVNTYKRVIRQVHGENEVLAHSLVHLDASKIRMEESNFGNLLADSFVFYAAQKFNKFAKNNIKVSSWTDAPIGIVNAGALSTRTLTTTRGKSNITEKMLTESFPYPPQKLYTVALTGEDIKKSLEIGVKSSLQHRGGFLQVSGIRVQYDYNKPVGDRVVDIKIKCDYCKQPFYPTLVPQQTYRVITTGFLVDGGDGHIYFKTSILQQHKPYDTEALIRLVNFKGKIRPECDERIIITEAYNTPSNNDAPIVTFNFNYYLPILTYTYTNFIL